MKSEAEAFRDIIDRFDPPPDNPKVGDVRVTNRPCHCMLCEGSYNRVIYHDKWIWNGKQWIEYNSIRDAFIPWLKRKLRLSASWILTTEERDI